VSSSARGRLVDYLERQLIGPVDGPWETVRGFPTKRYLMGILFPQDTRAEVELLDEDADTVATEGEAVAEDPVALSGQWLPSSIGISFFAEAGTELSCAVWGARYERSTDRRISYRRIPIAEPDRPETQPLPCEDDSVEVLDGRAEIRIRAREIGDGTLYTATLVNLRALGDEPDPAPEDCLFQVGLSLTATSGVILEYPSVALIGSDEEEQELRLHHRAHKTFAVGHGCAAGWGAAVESTTHVRSETMPRRVVPAVVANPPADVDDGVLSPARLGDETCGWETVRAELIGFVDVYETFVRTQALREDVPVHMEAARTRVVARLERAVARMRAGITALDDDIVRCAFRLANRAMAIQRARGKLVTARTDRGRHTELAMEAAPDGDFRWHPFQLAFLLLTLPSLADPAHDDRTNVDLIWFPTGGGKTEAYLAVAATEIFLRRLRLGPRGGGTAVLTRYTLRLLTTQQFERAAATICACELLRAEDPQTLGDEFISIGLWVGERSAPNHYADAYDRFRTQRQADQPQNPFQLDRCPWCGTGIFPTLGSEHDEDYGIVADLGNFAFRCPHDACPFHAELPVQVVDEALYEMPPTLLLGTVDKFTQLVWRSDGGAFFGDRGRCVPPSLIIQDELHLLSGPLGTTVGVYEAAIEALCAREGTDPKIVASTATIRRAGEQVKGLFAGRDVVVFPPAGVDASDSFFARVDPDSDGRLYVGVMAQSHTLATAMVHLSAALLQGVAEVDMDDRLRDAYWTLVAYHNSLRELGRTVTLARDDVPARIGAITSTEAQARPLEDEDVVELTGNITETSDLLRQLAEPAGSDGAISVLACTNMLSVGVDVPRLGLMVVNGQPKTASEYIQATSRVGRSADRPGLVVALLTSTKPRDRSHYENFHPFHSALYRHVEPTSVTPWSPPSRRRALHAAFTLLVRHLGGLERNGDAHRFRRESPAAARARQIVLDAVAAADPEEVDETAVALDSCAQEWVDAIEKAEAADKRLHFRAEGKAVHALLRDFGTRNGRWATLHSMRSVDRECQMLVRGEGR
jgi:hypothetical protein